MATYYIFNLIMMNDQGLYYYNYNKYVSTVSIDSYMYCSRYKHTTYSTLPVNRIPWLCTVLIKYTYLEGCNNPQLSKPLHR